MAQLFAAIEMEITEQKLHHRHLASPVGRCICWVIGWLS